MPARRASSRLDQCVAPSGISSSVRTTTSSTWASVMVRGTPGRGSSPSPSSRRARKRARHLVTVPRFTRSRAATAMLDAAVRAGQHDPRPQRQPLSGFPPLRPVLQRPPLGLGQHQRLKPVITHTASRPRTLRPRHHQARF